MSILYLNLVLYLIVSVFIRPHLFDDLPACQPVSFNNIIVIILFRFKVKQVVNNNMINIIIIQY